ncbi:MAG: 2-amino-4-hydroxy-6-hydroxymethyldihydropteridine diphosphokinase [Bryobacteraceae bacterium]
MHTVYLSLGSNIGDRRRHLDDALKLLQDAEVSILRVSRVYETEPQDFRNQPQFLNLAAEAETRLFPLQLLHAIERVERRMGRKRLIAKGPRIIDIDILLYGGSIVGIGDLQIPHPRMALRRFVLEPLAELAPDLRHPVTQASVAEMLSAVRDQEVWVFD